MSTSTTSAFSWNKDDWASLSEMADGFDEYRPAYSRALDGRELTLNARFVDSGDEFTLTHAFSEAELSWRTGEQAGTETYELFEMQPGLFYLHYRRSGEDHPVVVSAALDLTTGQVTGAVGELGLGPNPHLARQRWFQGQIAGSAATSADAHEPTDELIGRRVRYAYSRDDVYDHVYLNENLFTWLCIGGAELGVGDTDSCTYWKLREHTYLFSWLEKNVGVEGMVLVDLNALRTVGIQFGIDQQSGDLVNITMGSYAREFERTPSVDDARPGPTA
ncbi:molybdenum cofactor biosynthesis F family protein [Rhodococcus sp. USK10]|uniref:MoaF C-terminal domain-containing protein n=1 Tax=Rhodococcus sp. USK10 TaxID=2789739 RepID=UPI001C5E95A2|nr:MoaF C-terminal domain-containing protein [Rhodococcus sp. USK10]QYB01939.1 molybdenum cofactor biosynthesis F family protein [Rhodococcus sp. USK10]